MKVDGEFVEIDESLDLQCQGSHAITRMSATQLKEVVRRKEPVYLVHLSQMLVDGIRLKIVIAECIGMHSQVMDYSSVQNSIPCHLDLSPVHADLQTNGERFKPKLSNVILLMNPMSEF
jgi:hypothetical protein